MNAKEIRDWLAAQISRTARIDAAAIDVNAPFDAFGVSSLEAVSLSGELETLLGRSLSPTLLYEHPSIAALATFLAKSAAPSQQSGSALSTAPHPYEPIAITGMACRFPGADSPAAFWKLLREGTDMIREVPADRWRSADLYDPDPTRAGKSISTLGGFLDRIDFFDPFFFGISPGEAERMDPQQRLLLELAYESFEDAGYTMARLAGSRTGVMIGISVNEYAMLYSGESQRELITGHSGTGAALSIAANRISYFFDLHGPSLAVDTACSSSLTAIHLACRSIRAGECDLAIAGGVNLILSPAHSIAFTKAGVLACDGRCKSFDAAADGYVRGEGGGLVVLKPLAQAIADGDPIYALIRGSALMQDGRTNGLMAPNGDAQETLLRAAYRDAAIAPASVQYVEAHGTGTLLGDSMEARALGAVLSDGRSSGPCAIGSVKSNFGHLEAAAGVAGLMKVVLSLTHRAIPPSLHYSAPNPTVPFESLALKVQTEFSPWPAVDDSAVAAVSSFGFGGTNAHVVLEEAPHTFGAEEARHPQRDAYAPQLLPLSAHTPDALRDVAHRFREYAGSPEVRANVHLSELCAAASLRRNHLDCRLAVIARSLDEMIERLDCFLRGEDHPDVLVRSEELRSNSRKVAFVFSGQGSQRYGMCSELAANEPVFREALQRCDSALQPHLGRSILEQFSSDSGALDFGEIDLVQPTLFAAQVALAELWQSWGIVPDSVVGHSMGEVAAAHCAGILSLTDAAHVICARSRLLKSMSGKGGMAVVGLSSDETEKVLARSRYALQVAASNGPRTTVVTGDYPALDALAAEMQRDDVYCQKVNVDVASHGADAALLASELSVILGGVESLPGRFSMYSTVTEATGTNATLDSQYWAMNLAKPVNFVGAMQRMLADDHDCFIEMSPHPLLRSSMQQAVISRGATATVLASLERDKGERESLLHSLASLHSAGHKVDWHALHPAGGNSITLPTYPWQRQRFWLEPIADRALHTEAATAAPRHHAHPFLGERIVVAGDPTHYLWQADIDLRTAPYLEDHRVSGRVVLPAAVLIEMMHSAASQVGLAQSHTLSDISFVKTVFLGEAPTRMQLSLKGGSGADDDAVIAIHGADARASEDGWTLHATAALRNANTSLVAPESNALKPSDIREKLEAVRPEDLYDELAKRGLVYGPKMRCIRELWRRDGEALSRINRTADTSEVGGAYHIHPAIFDAALQTLAAAAPRTAARSHQETFVPAGCRSIAFFGSVPAEVWSHIVLRGDANGNSSHIEADVRLFNETGRTIATLNDLRLARVVREEQETWQYTIRWRNASWPVQQREQNDNRWLLLAEDGTLVNELKRQLEMLGATCRVIPLESTQGSAQLRDSIIEQLKLETAPVRGVVFAGSAESVYDAVPAATLRNCGQLLALTQALTLAGAALSSSRLWTVTRGAQAVRDGDPVHPAGAAMWGLGKSIAFEMPELRSTLVDLDPRGDVAQAFATLCRQLMSSDDEDQIALRGDERMIPRLGSYSGSAASCSVPLKAMIREDATYLIAGGLGGIGLTLAEGFVDRGARHLVLVGRQRPSSNAEKVLADLRARGVSVAVRSADVSHATDILELFNSLRTTMPPIKGVVHAAGVLDNGPLVSLDGERLERVMAAKVSGAWQLHSATRQMDLDFFVLFSSAVSVLGSPGQGNYSAANSFLDALAHHRRRAGLPATSINWGPWDEVGLVAGGSSVGAHASSEGTGVKGIKPQQGLRALDAALLDDSAQTTILPFDLATLLELYPAAARIPFFAEVGGGSTHVSKLYARPRLRETYVAPRNEYERKLAELWRQTLRIDQVGVRDSFFELGGDSVLAAQIITAAHKAFGVTLDVRAAFQSFTVESLARSVATSLEEQSNIAVPPAPEREVQLSFVQERQLFLEVLDPGTAVNNLATCVKLTGPIDLSRLEESANRIVARHDVLRTSFAFNDGRARSRTAHTLKLSINAVDLRDRGPNAGQEALWLASAVASQPFDLEQAPLLRLAVYLIAPREHVLLIVVHHTIADGWSLGVLLRELFNNYRLLAAGSTRTLAPLALQYSDFAARQREAQGSPAMLQQLHYWKEQLRGELPVLDLPIDHPRSARQTFNGATHRELLPKQLSDAIRELSRSSAATPFMTLLAAYQTLLHRYCRQNDIVVGTPIAGRTHSETQELIGAFINTLVLRNDLSGNHTFGELLQSVRNTALAAYAHQEIPFEKLVAELRPQRDLSRTPVFQAMLIMQNSPLPDTAIHGLELELLQVDRGAAQFDLTVLVNESSNGFQLDFEYNRDLFEHATIERMATSLRLILERAVALPDTRLSDLPLISEQERDKLLIDFNDTAADFPLPHCVHDLLREQALRTPEKRAIVCNETELSYQELHAWADALAAELRQRGVRPNSRVGVFMHRSVELVVALLAVLKAGGAYVPIDPAWPAERVNFVLRDADVVVALTDAALFDLVVGAAIVVIRPTSGPATLDESNGTTVTPEDLAYLIYTSGSTGAPKGVLVPHRALVNLLLSMRELLSVNEDLRLLAVTSVSFDIAALELFLPLMTGGTVVLATAETTSATWDPVQTDRVRPDRVRLDRVRLQETIAKYRINMMQATPAMWRMVLQGGWPGKRDLVALCGGDQLTAELAEKLGRRVATLWNVYGPTETTVWSTACRIERGTTAITIGRPIANTQLYILDEQLQPVPMGVSGELYIGGDGVSLGYLKQPELTRQKFIAPPPWLAARSNAPLFRTGDMARYQSDGAVALLGRLDQMVKLNGFRIEPGEIESALSRHPLVREAVVVVRETGDAGKHLVAFFVAEQGRVPAHGELRRFLRGSLPSYLIPAVFVAIPELPLTTAGKVDRRTLPVLDAHSPATDYSPPTTPLEQSLCAMYASVLGIPQVGVNDNFFDLGGGSIQILEIVARAQTAGLSLAPEWFFEFHTVAQLAAMIDGVNSSVPSLVAAIDN